MTTINKPGGEETPESRSQLPTGDQDVLIVENDMNQVTMERGGGPHRSPSPLSDILNESDKDLDLASLPPEARPKAALGMLGGTMAHSDKTQNPGSSMSTPMNNDPEGFKPREGTDSYVQREGQSFPMIDDSAHGAFGITTGNNQLSSSKESFRDIQPNNGMGMALQSGSSAGLETNMMALNSENDILSLNWREFRSRILGILKRMDETNIARFEGLHTVNQDLSNRLDALSMSIQTDDRRVQLIERANQSVQAKVESVSSSVQHMVDAQNEHGTQVMLSLNESKKDTHAINDQITGLRREVNDILENQDELTVRVDKTEQELKYSVDAYFVHKLVASLDKTNEQKFAEVKSQVKDLSDQVARHKPEVSHAQSDMGREEVGAEFAQQPEPGAGNPHYKPGSMRGQMGFHSFRQTQNRSKSGDRFGQASCHSIEYKGTQVKQPYTQNQHLGLAEAGHNVEFYGDDWVHQNGYNFTNVANRDNHMNVGNIQGNYYEGVAPFNSNSSPHSAEYEGINGSYTHTHMNAMGGPTFSQQYIPQPMFPMQNTPMMNMSVQREPMPPQSFDPLKDLPKLDKFSGTGSEDWIDWITQFEAYAELKQWQNRAPLLRLLFTGKASEYFNQQPIWVTSNYDKCKEVMNKRFGTKVPLEAIQSSFQTLRQRADEEIRDYADRVRKTARQAFSELQNAEGYIEKQMIQAFLRGLSLQDLSVYGFGQKYNDLEECVDGILVFSVNRNIIQNLPKSVGFNL